ncbi:MAG: LysR family transcriptional regulator [Inquilinus sp.]|uniref:LysR family transcriptional regulator n=1 Tax=Inquilinus sp. TaxID=1932117 RepID=UPI003F30F0F4
MIDLARLRLLRELARRGTMTAVAAASGLTSSAVSQQLATLEREARVALLERVGRRVRLTAEGARLVRHAETILQAVEAAERDLAGDAPRGVIEIACFPSFAKARLIPAVIRTRARFPELQAVIHEMEPAEAVEALRDGHCDLAFSFAYTLVPRPDAAGLVAQPLLEEPIRLALPPAWRDEPDPVDLRRLADQDWIVGSRQADDRRLAERACAAAGFAPRMTHAVDDYDLELRMVAAGLGVGFVPELALQLSGATEVVVRTPAGPPLHRSIQALTRSALAASPMVRAVLSELVRPSATATS